MDDRLWILIYSKFSQSCQKLLNYINQNDVSIPLNFLCIDGKDMRSRVLLDNKIKITYVPCIVCINQSTGIANQYEGGKTFELVLQATKSPPVISRNREPQISFHSNVEPLDVPMVPEKVESSSPPLSTPIENLLDESPQEDQEVSQPVKKGGKLSVSNIMASASREQPNQNHRKEPPRQEPQLPTQSGPKISVAEIMAKRGQ